MILTAISSIYLLFELANQSTVAISGELQEDLSDAIPIAGAVLVGASVGGALDAIALESLALVLPGRESSTSLCVEAKTRDGRYRAQFSGQVDAGGASPFELDPTPPWQFADVVSEYAPQAVAIIGRLGPACQTDPDAVVVPAVLGAEPFLRIAVNSQRSTSTRSFLHGDGGEVLEGICSTDTAVRSVSFNAVCEWRFDDALPRGQHVLTIERRTRVGPASDRFVIELP